MVAEAIRQFLPLISHAAGRHGLDAQILGGLVYVESSGNPWAIRVERGFWARYGAGVKRAILGNAFPADDRWLAFPDLTSASYGLCQIMYPVAVEHGARFRYPTELLAPELNLALGAKILASHLARRGSVEKALLAYNGGGDPHYLGRVLAAATDLRGDNV